MKGWKRILLSYNSWELVKILPNSPLLLTETWQSKFLSSLHFFFTHHSFETPSPIGWRLLQPARWPRTHSSARLCAACLQISLSQPRARTEMTRKRSLLQHQTQSLPTEAVGMETDTTADSPTINWPYATVAPYWCLHRAPLPWSRKLWACGKSHTDYDFIESEKKALCLSVA